MAVSPVERLKSSPNLKVNKEPKKLEAPTNAQGVTYKGIHDFISVVGEVTSVSQKNVTTTSVVSEAFSEDEMMMAWLKFAHEARNNEQNTVFHALKSNEPKLSEGNKISFVVNNETQFRFIKTVETELLSHLRKELNNSNVQLSITKEQTAEKESPPTSDFDKLKEMMTQNPYLKEMQQKFKLTIE